MELLFIGLIVLIVFGPRKIPELAKTAGKWMYEIRKVSNDFKETWEREAALTDEEKNAFEFDENIIANDPMLPDISEVSGTQDQTEYVSPEVSEITDPEQLESLKNQVVEKTDVVEKTGPNTSNSKQNWL